MVKRFSFIKLVCKFGSCIPTKKITVRFDVNTSIFPSLFLSFFSVFVKQESVHICGLALRTLMNWTLQQLSCNFCHCTSLSQQFWSFVFSSSPVLCVPSNFARGEFNVCFLFHFSNA